MIAIAATGCGSGRDTKRNQQLAFCGAIDHWVKAPFGRLANGIHAHVETQGYVLMQQAKFLNLLIKFSGTVGFPPPVEGRYRKSLTERASHFMFFVH